MAVAEKYMKAAGYSSGKYDGNDELLMVSANVDPGKAQAEVAKAQLEKLGFKVRLRTVPQDAVYTEWCQQPAKKVAVCGTAGWFKDFNDPQSMLEPTFKGSNYIPVGGNNNLAQLQDPKIDKAMDDAALLEGDERYQAWGEIDKMITDAGSGRPVHLGRHEPDPLEERERGRQRVHELVRPRVHLDQVRGTGRTTDDDGRPRTRGAGRVVRSARNRMGAYITRRLLWTVLLLWVVSGITFIVFNVLPSADPALLARGPARRAGGHREHPRRRSASTSRCTSSTGTT